MGKTFENLLLFLFLFLLFCSSAKANTPLINIGFESGTFTGWKGYQWLHHSTTNGNGGTKTAKTLVSLPTSRRHVIISDNSAYDANTGGALKKIPVGYRYSARLGDAINENSDSNPRGWEQSLEYTMAVDSSNSLLILKFACVLQYASDHNEIMEPRFKLTLYDNLGNKINTCTNYDVYASGNSGNGFKIYNPSGARNPVMWRDWTTVGADLSPYIGQNITIEFMSADCLGKYHFGYAYFVVDYQSMSISTKYCTGDSVATLSAPEGFESYSWKNESKNIVGNQQIFTVNNPVDGASYTCVVKSETGCYDSLTTTIKRYEPVADFSYEKNKCDEEDYEITFLNNSTTNNGTLSYLWNFGEATSIEQNPTFAFTTSGWHQVSLTVTNNEAECSDTKTDSVETFYPPLIKIVGDSLYCPESKVVLAGTGADHYDWEYNGNTYYSVDSILVGSPGGVVKMTGYSSDNLCFTTKYMTILETPEWNFECTPDTAYCQGDSVLLQAGDADIYYWNTGSNMKSIYVKTVGTYSVKGINEYGCEKTVYINVKEKHSPSADFEVSATFINERHNFISTSVSNIESDANYSWNFGDSTYAVGVTSGHAYYDTNLIRKFYTITLKAENTIGCVSYASKNIEIQPFIPNVFTPNGDGINDVFLADEAMFLIVYDRNGIKIFEGNGGWDGKYQGQSAGCDTYFYVIKYTDIDGIEQVLKGFVQLTR